MDCSIQPHTDMDARRALLLGLISVLGIAWAEKTSDVSSQNQKPSFCGTSDCPKYQLVKQYDNFEHRQYEETRWVKTSLEEDVLGIEMVLSFRRLYNYISGANAEELKMNMTVPVIIYVPLQQPSAGNATMSFFVPHEVKNPPKPTDPKVHLYTYPAASAYVKTFGGYALHRTFTKQADALAKELRGLGLQFDDTFFVRVGYNDPFTLFKRHNEVWYIAK